MIQNLIFWPVLVKILSMNNFDFLKKTPTEIDREIAQRVRAVRRRRKISQEKLSEKSGVSLGSLKRFERTGQISLLSLTKLAVALGMQQELERLFTEVPFLTIEEVINENDEAT